jgi:DNA-binding CsgD family transcriptional regulator
VIDGRGRVKHANRLAQELMGDGVTLVGGRPTASDPAINRRLQQLISSALVDGLTKNVSCVPTVIDRDEAPWLWVEAMPVTAFRSDLFSAGRAILLLTDLTSQPQPDIGLLRIAFGLTAAEARLAATLASGIGLTEAAAARGINRETARSQLKSVFVKTGTRRQAELTGLIARLRPFDVDR